MSDIPQQAARAFLERRVCEISYGDDAYDDKDLCCDGDTLTWPNGAEPIATYTDDGGVVLTIYGKGEKSPAIELLNAVCALLGSDVRVWLDITAASDEDECPVLVSGQALPDNNANQIPIAGPLMVQAARFALKEPAL